MVPKNQRQAKEPAAKMATETRSKTKVRKTDRGGKSSPFLTLPPELRNRIYGLTMPQNEIIHRNIRRSSSNAFLPGPALAYTCKEIYAEYPLKLYYAQNTLYLINELPASSKSLARLVQTCQDLGVAFTIENIKVQFSLVFRVPATYGVGIFTTVGQASFVVKRAKDGGIVVGSHSMCFMGSFPVVGCKCQLATLREDFSGPDGGLLAFVKEYLKRIKRGSLLDTKCPGCLRQRSRRESDGQSGGWVVHFV